MNRSPRFGHLPGTYVGQSFATRIELSLSGIHPSRRAGISGSQREGAVSVVLAGAYEDDEDHGDTVLYTGQGGRSLKSGKQVVDQDLVKGNLALAVSCQRELPVRLVRGANPHSPYAPEEGYRYDGLYRVESYWQEAGRSGYRVWRYRLMRWEE